MKKIVLFISICTLFVGCTKKNNVDQIKKNEITLNEAIDIIEKIETNVEYTFQDEDNYYFILIGQTNDINNALSKKEYIAVSKSNGQVFTITNFYQNEQEGFSKNPNTGE